MNLAALVMASVVALGGMGDQSGVVGSARQAFKVMPDTMEMTVALQASDEQFDKALAAVQQQDADLEKALHALQPAPADVKNEGPVLGPGVAGDRSAMIREQMMRAMNRPSGDKAAEKPKVTVSITVTAKWKLASKEGVALLKETQALQEAVRAAIPKPPAPAEGAATEEQEEQAMAQTRYLEETEQAPPGTPTFSFTAALPADKLAEAKAQAFKKARADAESLAQAAGMKLGALRSLSGGMTPTSGPEEAYYYAMMARQGNTPEEENVARSPEAREMTVNVYMGVVYDMAPAQ